MSDSTKQYDSARAPWLHIEADDAWQDRYRERGNLPATIGRQLESLDRVDALTKLCMDVRSVVLDCHEQRRHDAAG